MRALQRVARVSAGLPLRLHNGRGYLPCWTGPGGRMVLLPGNKRMPRWALGPVWE